MGWDYASLSHAAKLSGGPEKLVEKLIRSGVIKGVVGMIPVAVGAYILGEKKPKIVAAIKEKKAEKDREIEATKSALIEGINEYDATHPEIVIHAEECVINQLVEEACVETE